MEPYSRKAKYRTGTFASICCFTIVFLCYYLSTLTNDYAHADDYFDFLQEVRGAASGFGWVFDKRLLEGRPLLAFVYIPQAWFVDTLSDVKWIRLFGIFGIAIASWCVFHELVRQGFDRLPSFAAGIMVGSSVPFQLAVSWASVSVFPYAFAMSYAAFRIAEHSTRRTNMMKYALAATSTLCLLAVFWIHQTIAMSFWAFFAIGILRKQDMTINDVHRTFVFLAVTAAATAMAYLTYKTAIYVLPYDDYRPRGNLIGISDILPRIEWFMKRMAEATVFPLTPNEYLHLPLWQLPFVIILAGLVMYLASKPSFIVRGAIACTLPFLCHGIMLATHQGDLQRAGMALSSLVVVYVFFSAHGYARYIRRTAPSVFVAYAMGIIAFLGVALSQWHNERQFVKTNVRELAFIRSELQQHDLALHDAIHVVRPACDGLKFVARGYLGSTTCHEWAVPYIVEFVLIDLSVDRPSLAVSSSAYRDHYVPRPNTVILDMERGIRIYH